MLPTYSVAFAHGQPASLTTMGKEMAMWHIVYNANIKQLENLEIRQNQWSRATITHIYQHIRD